MLDSRVTKDVIRIVVGASASVLIYTGLRLAFKVWHNNYSNLSDSSKCEVIFFPDEKVACRTEFTTRHGCTSPVCKFSHDSNLSYAKLMTTLNKATKSVDVCVFCFTAAELGSILCEMNKKGVAVRVITDSDQVSASGSQVGLLRKEGK